MSRREKKNTSCLLKYLIKNILYKLVNSKK